MPTTRQPKFLYPFTQDDVPSGSSTDAPRLISAFLDEAEFGPKGRKCFRSLLSEVSTALRLPGSAQEFVKICRAVYPKVFGNYFIPPENRGDIKASGDYGATNKSFYWLVFQALRITPPSGKYE